MTDAEKKLLVNVRNGVILIMRALIEYYGLGWYDFIPRSALVATQPPAYAPQSATQPPEYNDGRAAG